MAARLGQGVVPEPSEGTGDGMLGTPFQRCGDGDEIGSGATRCHAREREIELALDQGSGLVERNGVDAGHGFESLHPQ
jgi:hypothetical protein